MLLLEKILSARGLVSGINFHVHTGLRRTFPGGKVVLHGGGKVNLWLAESELQISCDLKFVKGVLKVIFLKWVLKVQMWFILLSSSRVPVW